MSTSIELGNNTNPDDAQSGKGRLTWNQTSKTFEQTDQDGVTSTLTGSIGWGSISGTIESQLDLNKRIRTELVIKSISDLTPFLVGTSYELPFGRYVFDQDINIGTNNIKLMDENKFYTFKFSDINNVTYTGLDPMFQTAADGIAIKMDDGFLTCPNAEVFNMTNGNSLILSLPVLVCKKVGTITNTSFVTLNNFVMVGSDDGLECINCGTITCQLLQWSSGTNTGGTGLTVSGANSERLIISTCDARPESTETYLDIQSSYGGNVSIIGGSFSKSLNGDFFSTAGKDQTDPTVKLLNVANVKDSTTEIFGHFAGNTTATVISIQDTPVKINAGSGWGDEQRERFSFNSSGTWTYTGIEDVCVAVTLAATVNPSGGGSVSISTYFAKNSTVQDNTRGNVTASTGGQITSVAIIDLVTGDTIEAWIENNDGTANITVEVASIRIP